MIANGKLRATGSAALGLTLLVALGFAGPIPQMPAGFQGAVPLEDPRQESEEVAHELTALEVLARVRQAYREAGSYRDQGEVATTFLHPARPGPPRTTIRPFSTAFVRDGELFHFEYRDQPVKEVEVNAYHVWSDGEAIRSWWTIQPTIKEHRDFAAALSGPFGISGGSALAIPGLLIAELSPMSSLLRLSTPELSGSEEIDGHLCVQIEGLRPNGQPAALWIDRDSFLIRRYFARQHVDPSKHPELRTSENAPRVERDLTPFDTETTISFRPELNVKIPRELFDFKPPE